MYYKQFSENFSNIDNKILPFTLPKKHKQKYHSLFSLQTIISKNIMYLCKNMLLSKLVTTVAARNIALKLIYAKKYTVACVIVFVVPLSDRRVR